MFTVLELQDNLETVGVLTYSFDNELDAQKKYHEVLFYGASSEVPIHSAVMIGNGNVYRCDSITHITEDSNVIIEEE